MNRENYLRTYFTKTINNSMKILFMKKFDHVFFIDLSFVLGNVFCSIKKNRPTPLMPRPIAKTR